MSTDPMPVMPSERGNDLGFEIIREAEPYGHRAEPMLWWVRLALVGMACGLIAVFVIGACLRPYEADGRPRTHGTHQQLGLPPCSFYALTGWPCPSCGFTTSFSLVAHGDIRNAFGVNSVGTLLALYCLVLIPWAIVSAVRRRMIWIRSIEKLAIVSLIGVVTLMLIRWGILIGLKGIVGQL